MDSLQKAHTIIYTLPRVWLTRESSVLDSLDMFISALNHISNNLDSSDPKYLEAQEVSRLSYYKKRKLGNLILKLLFDNMEQRAEELLILQKFRTAFLLVIIICESR